MPKERKQWHLLEMTNEVNSPDYAPGIDPVITVLRETSYCLLKLTTELASTTAEVWLHKNTSNWLCTRYRPVDSSGRQKSFHQAKLEDVEFSFWLQRPETEITLESSSSGKDRGCRLRIVIVI